ncbi:MAG: nicotinamide-nucleotide adenylyltransferase [Methanospirillum sp.]|nr:nicotinamide-nucleotide adenylyltransferase [Methanospirillum sp.]
MKRVFYIGRFQPYHNGHQAVLEEIAREADEIVIGIGSAQLSHELQNPFTAGERVLMLTRSLAGLGVPFYVIPIEDIRRNAIWASHVQSMTPPFQVVHSSNPLVLRLFAEAGVRVRSNSMHERDRLSGTEVRRRILADEPWQPLVPPAVVEVIAEIDGVERLREIARSD